MKTEDQEIDSDAVAALTLKRGFTPAAVRAMVKARRMLALASASVIASLRDDPDAIPNLYARTIEGNINVSLLEWQSSLLHSRMSRVQPCHRPHYTPSERYQILVKKQTFGLTLTQVADMVLVSEQTISRWMTEATSEPDKQTIGSLLKASPPLMGYSQVVRDLVTQMGEIGFGGNLKIAQTLARAGVKLSKETARRWRNNPKPPHPPKDLPAEPKPPGPVLRAKRPNHIWMIDITEIPGLLGLFAFKLAVVIDVFSRMPLLGQIFTKNPTADEMANLVGSAAKKTGPPNHFVNDQGSQFTSNLFRAKLKELGAKQRFGAVGKSGSIAIIERLWRTVKESFGLKLRRPFTPAALQQRLVIGLYHYAHHRPHQGLGGATPAEIYYGKTPAHLDAVRPARAYEKRPDDKLFEIAYLDPDRRFGILLPKAA